MDVVRVPSIRFLSRRARGARLLVPFPEKKWKLEDADDVEVDALHTTCSRVTLADGLGARHAAPSPSVRLQVAEALRCVAPQNAQAARLACEVAAALDGLGGGGRVAVPLERGWRGAP